MMSDDKQDFEKDDKQDFEKKEADLKWELFGEARPDYPSIDPRTGGSLPQEDVEDRPNVSTVTPEDYPLADRETATPK